MASIGTAGGAIRQPGGSRRIDPAGHWNSSSEAFFHANLGMVLEKQGSIGEATACYRQAVALNPGIAELHYRLGNALRLAGSMPAAIDCLSRDNPTQPHASRRPE